MKFWKLLAWGCTAAFLVLLLISWATGYGSSGQSPELANEPPPAPTFH